MARPATWRVELLGDSITETSCTSQLVFAKLRADGHANFDLVGTKRNEQGCGVDMPDRDCEGHSGYLVTDLASGGPKAAEPRMWANADHADVVLMHFGTNDAWNSGIPIAKVLQAYSAVLVSLRAAQPNVVVFVAQIIPLRPDGCADCEARVRTLNDQIPGWAMAESRAESPVFIVDQWSGFDVVADTDDRVHPNLAGAKKMADAWVRALYTHGIF
jgi:lysophospholipase L1-like esterase